MTDRANPFANLGDFEPKVSKRRVPASTIEKIADETGFPSRSGNRPIAAAGRHPSESRSPRRYTTGRNRQINIKATSETIERLYALADRRGVPLGALLEKALDALEEQDRIRDNDQ